MSTDTIILAGRGASIEQWDFPDDIPIAAVSSGVFAVPRKPKYFIGLDPPKYFSSYWSPAPGSWCNDPNCDFWDVLEDPSVEKHVPLGLHRRGFYRIGLQEGEHRVMDFEEALIILGHLPQRPDLIGYQAGWADYRNTHGHWWNLRFKPNFTDKGPMGCGGRAVIKSIMFAVQVVARLGYKRVLFTGVDLLSANMKMSNIVLRSWEPLARAKGIEWINCSRGSRLEQWMPTEAKV